jgi:phage-related protein
VAGTLVKKVMLRIAADDGDTEEKLDKISAKADELGRKHPDIKVKIDSAAASAKLAVLRRELKDTGNAAKDDQGRFAALKDGLNVLTLGLSGGYGEMSMFQKVMAGMSIATGLGEPLVAGLTVAVGGLGAGLVSAGLGAGVFGLVAKSAYSQVSGAVTAFGTALSTTGKASKTAMAQYKAQMAALTPPQRAFAVAISSVQQAWQGFVAQNTGGVTRILNQGMGLLPAILARMQPFLGPTEHALSGIIRSMGKGIDSAGFKSFMDTMAKNSGPMLTGLAHAIGNVVVGIGGILKAFMPVSHSIMGGLDNLTAKFRQWGTSLSGHSGFKSLMSMFKSETPLAVGVLKQLGGVIKTVVAQMTGMSTFSNSKMLLQLALPILKLVNALLKAHPQLVWLILYLKLAADSGKKLKVAFEGISGALGGLKAGSKALSDLKSGFSSAEAAASDASGAWGSMGGKLSTVLQKLGLMKAAQAEATVATEGETAAQGELDVAMDANPIGIIIIAVAALAAGIYELAKHSKAFRDFWKAAWTDIKMVALNVFHVLEPALKVYADLWKVEWDIVKAVGLAAFHVIEDAVKVYVAFWRVQWEIAKDVVVEAWRLISGYVRINVDVIKAVLSWFNRLGSLFLGWFTAAANAVYSVTGKIVSFVRGIPGKIISGLSSLGSMLFGLGESAMQSLLHGLSSVVGGIISTAKGWGHDIANAIGDPFGIHFSEPSEASKMITAGRRIALGLGTGMDSGNATVRASAARLAASAGISSGGAAGAGGADQMVLTGHPDLMALVRLLFPDLRAEVRQRGGGGNDSAQRAFAQVTA